MQNRRHPEVIHLFGEVAARLLNSPPDGTELAVVPEPHHEPGDWIFGRQAHRLEDDVEHREPHVITQLAAQRARGGVQAAEALACGSEFLEQIGDLGGEVG